MTRRNTYSMLESLGRAPSVYEQVSSHLSWRVTRGCALPLPAEQWHVRHGAEAFLGDVPWESFADPASLTYRTWVSRSRARETFTSQLFAAESDPRLHASSQRVLGPLRFAGHALMMMAGYLGSLSPSGRLTIVLAFQAGDEMRRVHRFAERLFNVAGGDPTLAGAARDAWQDGPAWRPLRCLLERALVTWDWHESFAAVQLGIKSVLDEWCRTTLVRHATARGDLTLAGLLGSLALDHHWHAEWGRALVTFIREHSPRGADLLEERALPWRASALTAVTALDTMLEGEEWT